MMIFPIHTWIFMSYILVKVVSQVRECSRTPIPVFVETQTRISRKEGESLSLPCTINNITDDFRVLWYAGVENLFWDQTPLTSTNKYTVDYSKTDRSRNSVLSISSLHRGDPEDYTCLVSSLPRGCRVNLKFSVTVKYGPVIHSIEPRHAPFWRTDTPDKIFVNETDDITLRCNTSCEPSPLFHWFKMSRDGEQESLLSFATEDTKHGNLTILNVSRSQSGIYRCQSTNPIGYAIKDVELVVQFAPEVKCLQSDIRAGPGSLVNFGCEVIANPAPTLYWMKDGIRLPDDGENTLAILKLDPRTDYGNYTCEARNEVGFAWATIEISGRPLAPVITNRNSLSRYRRRYNLTWSPVSREGPTSDSSATIPITRYVVTYQRNDTQNRSGIMVTVLWPDEPLSEIVDGRQEHKVLRDLKENSSYVGHVCPENDYGVGDCVSYAFRTSIVDFKEPATAKLDFSCANPDLGLCTRTTFGVWTPSSATQIHAHSRLALLAVTVGITSRLLLT